MSYNRLDSINQTSEVVELKDSAYDFWDRIQDHTTTEFAFWISIGLLLIVSMLKYVVSHKDTGKDWGHLIIEIPVDLCLVVLTILVTIYLKENLGGGFALITVTLLAIIICCITRRKSMDYSVATDKFFKSWLFGIITVFIAVMISFWIYKVII